VNTGPIATNKLFVGFVISEAVKQTLLRTIPIVTNKVFELELMSLGVQGLE
jgi:hypothetical protein